MKKHTHASAQLLPINKRLGAASDGNTGGGNNGGETATIFKAGDVVKIAGTTYYSGKAIPSNWVRAKNWVIYEAVSGSERVVINKSADGSSAIMSPVKRSDLSLVKNG